VSEQPKQVSSVPLVTSQPLPRGRNNLLLLFLLGCTIALAGGGTWYWLRQSSPSPDNHVTQWPREVPPDPFRAPEAEYEAALAHMSRVAEALIRYRETAGGGVRWPQTLEELQYFELLPPDFDFSGRLSGMPLVYQPDMPLNFDPGRYVLCHDIEIGQRRNPQTGYTRRGPRAAAAILADGTVKLIEGDDLEVYAGLNVTLGAGR